MCRKFQPSLIRGQDLRLSESWPYLVHPIYVWYLHFTGIHTYIQVFLYPYLCMGHFYAFANLMNYDEGQRQKIEPFCFPLAASNLAPFLILLNLFINFFIADAIYCHIFALFSCWCAIHDFSIIFKYFNSFATKIVYVKMKMSMKNGKRFIYAYF